MDTTPAKDMTMLGNVAATWQMLVRSVLMGLCCLMLGLPLTQGNALLSFIVRADLAEEDTTSKSNEDESELGKLKTSESRHKRFRPRARLTARLPAPNRLKATAGILDTPVRSALANRNGVGAILRC